jgi:hypothetical protein
MINQLFKDLSALPQIEAIALGGSRSTNHYDEKSDYDVYLYCTASIPEDTRREILSKYCSYMEIGNHFWEYEDNCVLNNGIDIDILYRNLDDFCAGVARVVEDFQPCNGYTTCMWHNLLTCKILCDKTGWLTAAKERFTVPYPDQLRSNIIEQNRRLLHTAMPAYRLQIEKAANRGDIVSITHRTAAFMESYFDILFALNRKTHPGEKRLISLCLENCPILPADFEENLHRLFSQLYGAPAITSANLQRVIEELEKIL